jgi:hypothetical protein
MNQYFSKFANKYFVTQNHTMLYQVSQDMFEIKKTIKKL